MGQAFDRDGNVLGEAEGESMREVLEKLERAHPAAAEMRIRKQVEQQEAADGEEDHTQNKQDGTK